MIAWVLKMFPDGLDSTTFLCRDEHLRNTDLERTLRELSPSATIVPIGGHKHGPIFSLMEATSHLDDTKPLMISYCDYYMRWDYMAFKHMVSRNEADGMVICYTGFHPHLHPHNYYACCKTDENGRVTDIREKQRFDDEPTRNLHSAGAYYFRNGALAKRYFQRVLDEEIKVWGEYYVSLAYQPMIADGLHVTAPALISHFCQWGTPEDLAEYQYWMECVATWPT